MNMKSTTTKGFKFRTINSLIESWGVCLTWLDCNSINIPAAKRLSVGWAAATQNLSCSLLKVWTPVLKRKHMNRLHNSTKWTQHKKSILKYIYMSTLNSKRQWKCLKTLTSTYLAWENSHNFARPPLVPREIMPDEQKFRNSISVWSCCKGNLLQSIRTTTQV